MVGLVLEAVPGAGKTHRLLQECVDRTTLFLAYNAQLALTLRRKAPADCLVLTFHALCARCLGPARDDAQLEDAVRGAVEGTLVPHDVPVVDRVLVDEAQDVRPLYVRLLCILGLTKDLVVAGDRNQLLYDFDPRHPASLEALDAPEGVFGGGPWTREILTQSHRLTVPIAAFVGALFDVPLTSSHSAESALPVEVRAPRSSFALFALLQDVLHDPDVLLIVDRKRNHRPLRALLNDMSRNGWTVRVHGIDHIDTNDDALQVATYWSAKGLECDTAVVLLPGRAARNATYVALTRARRRLIVVLDPTEPHAAVCDACARCSVEHVQVVGHACKVLSQGLSLGTVTTSLTRREWSVATPPKVTISEHVESDPLVVTVRGRTQEAGHVVATMARVVSEFRKHRRVQAMEDVLRPVRLDKEQRAEAMRAGVVARIVPRGLPESDMLAADLRVQAEQAYATMRTLEDVALVALAMSAWDGFDHVMRQLCPVSEWVHEDRVRDAIDAMSAVLDAERHHVEFDVPLDARLRAHAWTPEACYHVAWSMDVDTIAELCAQHPRKRCRVVSPRGVVEVTCMDPSNVL